MPSPGPRSGLLPDPHRELLARQLVEEIIVAQARTYHGSLQECDNKNRLILKKGVEGVVIFPVPANRIDGIVS